MNSSSTPCTYSPCSPTPTSNLLDPDAIETVISSSEQPESYNIIISQLLAATEKQAAKLGKAIMNELERRLLQRRQASPFETFLVTVILLACIGQMAWYFQKWELNCDGEGSWPLERPPSHYIEQSEQLRDLLYMLLKTRGIPRNSSNSSKRKGRRSNSSKPQDRTKKKKGKAEEASQYDIEGNNADSRSTRDETFDMAFDKGSDKSRSASTSSWTLTAKSSINKDDNANIARPNRTKPSPIEVEDDHRHKEIQDRWYATVRDLVLNDDIVMRDAPMEAIPATVAEKENNKEDVAGLLRRDLFDPNNPQSWEFKYIGALLKLGI